METTHIAVDTSKTVFTLHATDPTGRCTYRRDVSRGKFLDCFGKLAPLTVTLEACGGSHHWARELTKLGHAVRLIAPQHAKPFVKRGKNDRADAEAISEAASRPSMRFVPVKSCRSQADAMVLKHRALLVGQRTQLVNALRGHATEFGLVVARGTEHVGPLLAKIAAETTMPALARAVCAELGADIARLDQRLAEIDSRVATMHKSNPLSRLLTTIPGIGSDRGGNVRNYHRPCTIQVGPRFRRLSWPDAEGSFERRQTAPWRDFTRRRRATTRVAGARCHVSAQPRSEGKARMRRERVGDEVAGAQAAQSGGGCSGQ